MKIIRVFPRKTNLSPDDPLTYFGPPPFIFGPELWGGCDEVHISVAFTWDIEHAEFLAEQWKHIGIVKIGGPAFNQPSGDFYPGLYLNKECTITSRGCPNRCWFCSVPKREPKLIELPILPGSNILDDNLLACSEFHIRQVFQMLGKRQGPVQFTGCLEAARLMDWHVHLLSMLKPKQMFFAFDTPEDEEPLRCAARKLLDAGFTVTSKALRCYVLIGFIGDTFEKATKRLELCLDLGFWPMAMLWRDNSGERDTEWVSFQKQWARPAIINNRKKQGQ